MRSYAPAVCARRPRASGLAFAFPLPGKRKADNGNTPVPKHASGPSITASIDNALRSCIESNSFKYLFAGVRKAIHLLPASQAALRPALRSSDLLDVGRHAVLRSRFPQSGLSCVLSSALLTSLSLLDGVL
jgi:hypothetical protein